MQLKPSIKYIESKKLFETHINHESVEDDEVHSESFGQYQEEWDFMSVGQMNSEIDHSKSIQE